MHVRIDVKCMHTNFGGRGLSSFRDFSFYVMQVVQLVLTIHQRYQ